MQSPRRIGVSAWEAFLIGTAVAGVLTVVFYGIGPWLVGDTPDTPSGVLGIAGAVLGVTGLTLTWMGRRRR